jgi:hypothetical protein
MKYLVISDIHGNIEYARLIPEIIEREKPSNIVLLGDLFSYYGESEEIIDIYNRYAGITIGIKGNNDSLYDAGNLKFLLNNYSKVLINNKLFFFTHGHLYHEDDISESVDVYVSGHTHRSMLKQKDYLILANPGSLGLPRDEHHSYMIIDDETIYIKDIDGNILEKLKY